MATPVGDNIPTFKVRFEEGMARVDASCGLCIDLTVNDFLNSVYSSVMVELEKPPSSKDT